MPLNPKHLSLAICAALLTACSNADAPDFKSDIKTQSRTSGQSAKAIPASAKTPRTPMERGRILFKRCKACHTLDDGGRNKLGPNLWNIWGREAASTEGFAYSKALKAADITWDDTSLDTYIKKPKDFVPGTRMSFIGIKKAQDREHLLLYLKAQTTP